MTTIAKPIQPNQPTRLPPCTHCGGWMLTDRETEELFCSECSRRPKWNNGLSYISGNTSLDYMGTAYVGKIDITGKNKIRHSRRNSPAKYGPPTGLEAEIHQWDCIVVGTRIPWGELCYSSGCSYPKVERGVCKHHHTVLCQDGNKLWTWREAAAIKFGWARIEYEQWEEKGKVCTRVTRVWWPSYISHTTIEVIYPVMERFEKEKGYQLRQLRAALESKDLYLVDKLADIDGDN